MAGRAVLLFFLLFGIFISSCSERPADNKGIELFPFSAGEGSRWGFVDSEGRIAIDTIFKNMPSYFREGFAIVEIDSGVYDYIDEHGKLMNMRLQRASLFSEGLACVVPRNEAPCYIDEDMEVVFRIPFAEAAGVFSEGLAN